MKRKPLNKITQKRKELLEDRKQQNIRMMNFFLHIWNKREHVSEISTQYLGREALSIYFHHILPKESYDYAIYDEDNIILLTFDEHQKAESDPTFYEEINKRRELLKKKYGKFIED